MAGHKRAIYGYEGNARVGPRALLGKSHPVMGRQSFQFLQEHP
ncbi:hypothetical protein PsAD2_02819 [Pseudovibrio axinellae]|uniref:Uncharacterized protein n=1 Tax=Pseudovibrio axinellae TaxID=989403 RepID=A0A165XNI9_9HYPH|nr:hypothetical protein PsAD2_02819 [Pseudovibrio axinellae]SER58791.1 hypothetical protein SAMN05421798_11334 [Pseudovibrio axinellae]